MTLGSGVLSGRYRLGEVLGHGGMAVVYRGEDEELGRPVAIKVLRDQFSADPEFLERFRREGRAAAGLSHPNIITVFDVGRDGDISYIVMEYVEGEDLKEVIRRDAPLQTGRLVNLGCQLAAALEYAHRRGIVHRDIKPHNVLVTRDDRVKVGDFGIAVALGARSITQTGMVIGSVHYMAPEQAQGQPSTAASDVYSLGVVLYEMATGRLPFEAESALAVARMHIDQPPPPPQRTNPRLPQPIAEVILTALEKEPADRYQSAAEVAAALRGQRVRAAQRTAVLGTTKGNTKTQRAPEPTVVWNQAPPPTSRIPPRRAPARQSGGFGLRGFLLLAILLGIIGGAIGWFIGNPPQRPQPAPKPTAAPVIVATPPPTAAAPTPAPKPTVAPTAPAPTPAPKPTVAPTPPPPPPSPTTPPPPPTAAPKPTVAPTQVPRAEVPGVIGRTEGEAQRLIEQAGLDVRKREERRADAPNGLVILQEPAAGTPLERGRTVTIIIARSAPAPVPKQGGVRVPNVEGMDEREARQSLEGAGFKVVVEKEETRDRKGQVINQNPGAGDTVLPGATVILTLGV